jgi:hypothetical protein
MLSAGGETRGGEKQPRKLAAKSGSSLATKYLAEYRSLLQQNTDCLKIMREALELFINTGWPSARRLSYRVDEIFR